MNEETQRVVIARECGWKDVELRVVCEGTGMDQYVWSSGIIGLGGREIPDYLWNLNACVQFERTLKDSHTSQDFEIARYIRHLENLVEQTAVKHGWSFALVTATAAQRSEAFLRAMDLWVYPEKRG